MKNRESTGQRSAVSLGDLLIDLDHRRFTRNGSSWVPIEGLSFRLLEVLLDSAPASVSKRELLRKLWGETVVEPGTLTQRVRLLRRTLGGGAYVAAVKGYGYRIGLPVRTAPECNEPGRMRGALLLGGALLATALVILVMLPDHAAVHTFRHLTGH